MSVLMCPERVTIGLSGAFGFSSSDFVLISCFGASGVLTGRWAKTNGDNDNAASSKRGLKAVLSMSVSSESKYRASHAGSESGYH
jgi:hypothetical protein